MSTLLSKWRRSRDPAIAAVLGPEGSDGADARPRRFRRPWLVAWAVLLLLSPAIYSYTTAMRKPSSLSLGVPTVEWVRDHHGNWLVDEAEHFWYSWKSPKKGGHQLSSLPAVGLGPAVSSAHAGRPSPAETAAAIWPPPIKPLFPHSLPGEGIWRRTGPLVDGSPPVLVTTFRTEVA